MFPEPLYCWTLTQSFETTIQMVPDVAEWLIEPPANLSQFETLKIKQFNGFSLHLREIVEGRKEVREVDSQANIMLDVALLP